VFRRQIEDTGQPSEYLQVGFEVFDGANPIDADAEVFAAFSKVLAPYGLRAVIGDIGIITAAIAGLQTTDRRKAALNRHLWRPARFRKLLDRFAGRAPAPAGRVELLEVQDPSKVLAEDFVFTGLRSEAEILERIEGLLNEASAGPIEAHDVSVIDEILDLSGNAPSVLERLYGIAEGRPALMVAVERMGQRLEAFRANGVDIETLGFEASYGRGSLEYYDGFVFGFTSAESEGQPPIASGGRYDALTQVLARDKAMPAVGGIVRPGMIAAFRAGGGDA
jgi:ATP phosphoribosyltransferase regulatory subunit